MMEKLSLQDKPLHTTDPVAREVLAFWFGEPGSRTYGKLQSAWFQQDPMFDEAITRRFGVLHQQASERQWDNWQQSPETALALIIVLDQFSRNIYRHNEKAFAADPYALAIAKDALTRHLDQQVMPVARTFYYLPFEHSENLSDQQRAVTLFYELQQVDSTYAEFVDYAQRHYDVIAKFGRFPHRNHLLGRVSSVEEQYYLSQPGAGF